MKLIDATCPSCASRLTIDIANKQAFCQYCGARLLIDDEIQRVRLDDAEEAGYHFERGRMRAQAEAARADARPHDAYGQNPVATQAPEASLTQPAKPRRKTWLWVLGWLLVFPVPITILAVKDKEMALGLRILIVVVAWLLYFFLAGVSS